MTSSPQVSRRARRWQAPVAVAAGALAVAGCSAASAAPRPADHHGHHQLACGVQITTHYPSEHSRVGVTVTTVLHGHIQVTAHYKTISSADVFTTGGRHTFWYGVGIAPVGFKVVVDVRTAKGDRTGSCQTWFMPKLNDHHHPGPSPSPTATQTKVPTPTPPPTPTVTPTIPVPPPPTTPVP
jgi:hypothetical protein